MVKLILGAFLGGAVVVAGLFGTDGGNRIPNIIPGSPAEDKAPEPVTDPEKLKAAIEENSKAWRETKTRGEETRRLYQQRLATATERLVFVRHQQKKLAKAYTEAERNGFPMQWMSSYYEREEALEQLDRLLQEQEHLQISCEAFNKAIEEAQTCINDAVEKLANNRREATLAEVRTFLNCYRQVAEANEMPKSAFLQDLSGGPVRSVDELMAEQQEVSQSSKRLTRLNDLLVESADEDAEESPELPNRITNLLDQ